MSDAHKKFDYQVVGDTLKAMNNTFDSISTTLDTIDKYYNENVNQELKAIYGDLGSQLLLDWDNVSSNFPNFKTNFENWSAVVAASGGNYTTFENDLKGFKEVENGNYLGVSAKKAGVTDAYTNTGDFAKYTADNSDSYARTSADLVGKTTSNVDLSGIEYEKTDSKAVLTAHMIAGATVAGNTVSVSSTAASITSGTAAQPISEVAEALNDIDSSSGGMRSAALTAMSAAESHGAVTMSYDATAGVMQFYDTTGKLIGQACASNNWTFNLL